MVTCKKLVKVGVWAQVDQHPTSSNVGGSKHVKIIEVFHNSPIKLSKAFILFVHGINFSPKGQWGVQMK
jgi:hypothetical protein